MIWKSGVEMLKGTVKHQVSTWMKLFLRGVRAHACMHACVSAGRCMKARVWKSEDNLRYCFSLSPYVRVPFLLSTIVDFYLANRLLGYSLPPSQMHDGKPCFTLHFADSNSCPNTCTASTLPTEPSPKPCILWVLSANLIPGVWGAIPLYHTSLGSWDLLKDNLPAQLLFWTPPGYLTQSQMKGVKNLCSYNLSSRRLQAVWFTAFHDNH